MLFWKVVFLRTKQKWSISGPDKDRLKAPCPQESRDFSPSFSPAPFLLSSSGFICFLRPHVGTAVLTSPGLPWVLAVISWLSLCLNSKCLWERMVLVHLASLWVPLNYEATVHSVSCGQKQGSPGLRSSCGWGHFKPGTGQRHYVSLPQQRMSVQPHDGIAKISKDLREMLLIMERKRQSPNRKKKNVRPERGPNADVSPRMEWEPDSRGRLAAEGADQSWTLKHHETDWMHGASEFRLPHMTSHISGKCKLVPLLLV